MTALIPRSPHARTSWLITLLLLVTVAAPLPALPQRADSDPDEAPDTGFTASGEIQKSEEATLTLRPWQPRLPARLAVRTSARTRVVRQKKGRRADLAVGELVLVVEQPLSKSEKEQRQQDTPVRKQGKKKKTLRRTARARAVLRYWKADHSPTSPASRQIARALLEGARPYFRGDGRGSSRGAADDARMVLGAVTSLEPFTVRSTNRIVEYTVTNDTLVVTHTPVSLSSLKRGENILVQSPDPPATGEAVQAALVAVTPRPRLKVEQKRRLILRDRRADEARK